MPKYSATFESEILTIHRIIEAFKFAFAQRTELGDPDYLNITQLVYQLSSRKFGREINKQISDNITYNNPEHYGAVYYSADSHGTAHVSIISGDGDAVAATSTINLYFGAGVTSKGTGIILNSVMDDFSVPGQENYFQLLPSPNNFIAPGKRPLSSMAPTIVLDANGSVKLAISASGGTKIPTAIAWVIIRHLWFGEDIKQAIDASRMHHQLMPMEISYEYGTLNQIVKGLEALGHRTHRYRERGSIVCAVGRTDGIVYGNADYRKSGDVYGLD